ncbi:hypothetical protein Goshw_005302 [Gossypium schwendimanii]|uniref:Dirigent protein n=1 Tax=Gossypium schwendimanii TaxID=34291 RepID=A0A7J9LLU6_GOSSC|nr:hypothetical protein [Gossypium schwendimanii]
MVFAWVMIFCLAIAPVYGQHYSKPIKLGGRVEKKTRLRFFYHDFPGGKNPTTFTAVLYADFAFTTGRFNGSSFSLFSRYPPTDFVPSPDLICEMAIVGGRGAFKMAKGFALLRATSSNAMTGDASLEVNVTLYHY